MTDPDGVEWIVRRRWTPRWARVDVGGRFAEVREWASRRHRDSDADEVVAFAMDVGFELPPLAVVLWVIGVAVAVWFVLIPLLLVVFDVVVVVVALAVLTLIRILFRRPWTLTATSSTGTDLEREVVGWRASTEGMVDLARQIETGRHRPGDSWSDHGIL